MIFLEIFANSIKLPAKNAMFRLNRVGMDIILFYLFFLLIIVSLPSFINQLISPSGMGAELNFLFALIYFFIFYYLPMTVAVIIFLSFVAYIGKLMARMMKRKLHYGTIWKLSACAATIPFLLYTIIAFIYPVNDVYLLLSGIYILILLFKMIQVYPKRRDKSEKQKPLNQS